tara:strand:- start:767 stop:1657 length:891 start_codon:yes stop_codon:yes gene_type:complete
MPSISVIMSVRNASLYLGKSVESILNQTFTNFEFLIMDDGSSDNSLEKLKKYSEIDERIVLFSQGNKGLTKSLNFLIKKSTSTIIARMDADDICQENRFEKQISFLNKNKDYSLVGSNATCIDSKDKRQKITNLPLGNFHIKRRLNFYNTFIHSSVMFRKEKFIEVNGYDESFPVSQDYDLWLKMSKLRNSKFKNLKENLISLRIHEDSISEKNKDLQILCAAFSIYKLKKNLDIEFDEIGVKKSIENEDLFSKIKTRVFFIQKNLKDLRNQIIKVPTLEGYMLFFILFCYKKIFP